MFRVILVPECHSNKYFGAGMALLYILFIHIIMNVFHPKAAQEQRRNIQHIHRQNAVTVLLWNISLDRVYLYLYNTLKYSYSVTCIRDSNLYFAKLPHWNYCSFLFNYLLISKVTDLDMHDITYETHK